MRRISAILLRSFLQGLILLSPIAITAYLIYFLFSRVDELIPFKSHGIGFLIIIAVITTVGYLGTRFFIGRWLFDAFAYVLEHTPGIKHVYSSIKDVVESFVGDKKRFNKPVWLCISYEPETWRVGFMTQREVNYMGIGDKVTVYLPHAYAISGWVVVTDSKNIRPIKEMTAAEAMKFAVSGGITTKDDNDNTKKN